MNIPTSFNVAQVTLAVGCPLNCKFCPQDNFIKAYKARYGKEYNKYMTMETFKAILKNFEKREKRCDSGLIAFAGFSEPFLNPKCGDMIRYAYDSGYQVALYTTLVGMREEDLQKIKDIEFMEVVLHTPDQEKSAHFKLDENYLNILDKFLNSGIKINLYS